MTRLFFATIGLTAHMAIANDAYPSKPVRVLVGAPPGSGSDMIMRTINRDVMAVMNSAEIKEKLAADAAEAARPNTPEDFRKIITREVAVWDKFLRTSGIKIE